MGPEDWPTVGSDGCVGFGIRDVPLQQRGLISTEMVFERTADALS